MGMAESPVGLVETKVPGMFRVDVHAANLPNGFMHVGMIGTQDGANFCENDVFRQFTPEQRAYVLDQVRKQHGSASISEPVLLPEAIEEYEEDTEIE